jgi:hypothetical protein
MVLLTNRLGYSEKAVASFQAMVELNWNCPESIKKLSFARKRSQLEHYWENELTRFGEKVKYFSTKLKKCLTNV